MKYPEDEYCYGYNNDSYGHPGFLNPSFIIKEKHFFILVELKGSYLPAKTWKLEIKTEGMGDTFQIRYGEKWIKMEQSQATTKYKIKKHYSRSTS